jgi:hypothetical protein
MPKKLDNCVKEVMKQGQNESSAYAICNAALNDDSSGLSFEDAEYEGRQVKLNEPFYTSDEDAKFAVYVKNDDGEVVKVKFGSPDMEIKRDNDEARESFRARFDCENQDDPTSATYWSCKMWQKGKSVDDVLDCAFRDSVYYDAKEKRAVSVRDGVLEYYGHEIGLEPKDKIFTIYRSPATIASAGSQMSGIKLTDDHVDLNDEPKNVVGEVKDSQPIDSFDESYKSTLAIMNRINPHKEIQSGKQLSLAIVDDGRCGSVCTFLDKRKTNKDDDNMPKSKQKSVFLDMNGSPNLEKIVEMTQELPELIKKMPVEQLQQAIPKLQSLMKMGGKMQDEESMEYDDKDYEDMSKKQESSDSAGKPLQETQEFADAVEQAVERHNSVIDKAKNFVDSNYKFAGKSTEQIMRDSIATEYDDVQQFTDSELGTAFKMLKKSRPVQDSNINRWHSQVLI